MSHRRRVGEWTGAALALLLVGLGPPEPLHAQGYRAEVTVTAGYLELRPLARDSLPADQVPGDGLRRRLDDGTVVSCVPGQWCRWYRTAEVEGISVASQEVRLAAWPGVEGLSGHVHLRSRYGTDAFWPGAAQDFEAVSAYLSYDRGDYRVRAGRQFRVDGLGYYNFDGLALLWRGFEPLRLEAYGGWSLARGLNAPRTGVLLEEAEALPPDDRGLIFGAELSGRHRRFLSGSVTYQREIRTDRLALYSERVALDARALLGEAAVDVSAEYDVAYDQVNEARLRASSPLVAGVDVSAEARHYRPFFELWTIWGAFSPIGFTEGRLSAGWRVGSTGLRLEAGGAYRDYQETGGGADFPGLREDGWRAFGQADWARDDWFAGGVYRAEAGPGAARFGGDARLGRRFGPGRYVALRGSSTQTFGEFRLGEQRVSGAAAEVAWRFGELSLSGGAGLYRLTFQERVGSPDWTQARLHAGLSYGFGTDLAARSTSAASGGGR